jgi:hypothetical protein
MFQAFYTTPTWGGDPSQSAAERDRIAVFASAFNVTAGKKDHRALGSGVEKFVRIPGRFSRKIVTAYATG